MMLNGIAPDVMDRVIAAATKSWESEYVQFVPAKGAK
jgi:hypothetical protein